MVHVSTGVGKGEGGSGEGAHKWGTGTVWRQLCALCQLAGSHFGTVGAKGARACEGQGREGTWYTACVKGRAYNLSPFANWLSEAERRAVRYM